AEPDLMAVTGDLVDLHTRDLAPVLELMARLDRIAPVHLVLGNHEAESPVADELLEGLATVGVEVLRDQARSGPVRGPRSSWPASTIRTSPIWRAGSPGTPGPCWKGSSSRSARPWCCWPTAPSCWTAMRRPRWTWCCPGTPMAARSGCRGGAGCTPRIRAGCR